MAFFSWTRWLRSLCRSKVTPIRKRSFSLTMEQLETRMAPATDIWTGGGADNKWMTAANWTNGTPNPGDDLVFGQSGAKQLTNVNNFAAGTNFNSITFSASGYMLQGAGITLGNNSGTSQTGYITDNASAGLDTIALQSIALAGAGLFSGQQVITVNNTATSVDIQAKLTGTTGVGLAKSGTGTLTLEADNSGFNGPISINQGILEIKNSNALGDLTQGTTVASGAQLMLTGGANGLSIAEPLKLSGAGPNGLGALFNNSGNNTITGVIELDLDVTFGAAAGTNLTVATGGITDLGAGHSIVKEGQGTLTLTTADNYQGTTTVNNGVLAISNNQALGAADGTARTGTIVNSSITEQGTLELMGGVTVTDELLTLNGGGFGGLGALYSPTGNNVWTGSVTNPANGYIASGNVILGSPSPNNSPVTIRVDVDQNNVVSTLQINSVVEDPNTVNALTKIGHGTLIFTNANTYRGATTISQGILEISDSQALGATTAGTTVVQGGTLELAVNLIQGRLDSVTGSSNMLSVSEPLTIWGSGQVPPGGTVGAGALYSHSGINTYVGNVTLSDGFEPAPNAAIGVDPDPNASPNSTYITNDWSLTITGQIIGSDVGTFVGAPTSPLLQKVGFGQLILPSANLQFSGATEIEQGWITLENSNALGAALTGVTQDDQATITVESGGALHLRDTSGNGMTIHQNLNLTGTGVNHPFGLINQQGALENLQGANTIAGNIVVNGQTVGAAAQLVEPGIGVEKVFGAATTSQLITTGTISDTPRTLVTTVQAQNSFANVNDNSVIETGATSGTITIEYDMHQYFPPNGGIGGFNRIDVYAGINGEGGTRIGGTNGFVSNAGVFTVSYSNEPTDLIEIDVVGGGGVDEVWRYRATITPTPSGNPGGITKLGSQLLALQGDGNYAGNVDIKAGVLLAQDGTALGGQQGTTTVETGTALALANTQPPNNSGITTGIQVWGEHLVLNGPGNTTLGTPIAPLSLWSDASLLAANTDVITPTDANWRGPVTLATSVPLQIGTNSRLQIDGVIDDAANKAAAGSDLIKIGAGELQLSDANTYRGTTYIGTNSKTAPAGQGGDPDAVNEFFTGSATTGLAGGIVTVANGQALGATTAGTIVQSGSALQLQGSITVAGEPLTVIGTGDASAPQTIPGWFQQGPAPEQNGPNVQNQPVAGRVTAVAVDPNDTNVIYVGTAGGGVWKTSNGGQSWQQLFDNTSAMYIGAIAVTPQNPNIIYVGTGESDASPVNLQDSFYGTGVYQSTDAGLTWHVLTDPSLANPNPIFGQTVSKIAVDLINPQIIYVATSNLSSAVNNGIGVSLQNAAASPTQAGIWRYNVTTTSWLNLSGIISDARATAGLNTAGPDDDQRFNFTNPGAWTDLILVNTPPSVGFGSQEVLYAATGAPGLGNATFPSTNGTGFGLSQNPTNLKDPALYNAVFRLMNPSTATAAAGNRPRWDVGDGNAGGGGGGNEFPNFLGHINDGSNPPDPIIRNGTIKIAAVVENNPSTNPPPNNLYYTTLYAIVAEPVNWDGNHFNQAPLLEIDKSVDGGQTWGQATLPPNFLAQEGYYASSILATFDRATNSDVVFVGGTNDPSNPNNYVLESTNGGGAWSSIVPASGNAPGTGVHAMALASNALDVQGNPNGNLYLLPSLFVGTDNGIWQYQTSNNTWIDRNSNLSTSLVNGIAVDPSTLDKILAGIQNNGVALSDLSQLSAATAWTEVDPNQLISAVLRLSNGGQIRIDPTNPQVVYYAAYADLHNTPGVRFNTPTGFLFKSTNGGAAGSWTLVTSVVTGLPISFSNGSYPLVLDSLNHNRLLLGGGALEESVDGATTFTGLASPIAVTAIAIPEFQGPFVADSSFPLVQDQGTNTYDSNTIYVTNGLHIDVTKNHGTTWVQRDVTALTGTYNISDLEVDPRNRDIVYATNSDYGNGINGHVFVSLNAGQSWQDITNNLPDLPVWKLVIDPRNGTLYVGTDEGVYVSTNAGGTWSVFGSGLPLVQVKDLSLDQAANTLTAGTFGRGVWQLTLNGSLSNAGGVSAVSGQTVWTGPVTLYGPTTIGADGTQFVRNGIATASLNIVGAIGDYTAGNTADTLTKIGQGNVILSGTNTYAGLTDIQQGALIAANSQALGANPTTAPAGLGTVVENGAALQLLSSINNEPLTLNGDGPQPGFNGHNTGALESLANNNTYSGNVLLASNATVGVDSGSTLTITGAISGGFSLTKELTGTLIFADANPNTYTGATFVYQGILQIQSSGALNGSSGTTVLDGAQLQLQQGTLGPVNIASEPLSLSGTGISGTGALENTGGSNTWGGPVTLDANPGFSPVTYPVGVVSFNVLNAADTLTISGNISDGHAVTPGDISDGLLKVGAGTLALAGNNSYNGTTYVNSGVVKVQSATGLGTSNNNAIQRVTVFDPNTTNPGSFRLFYNGQPTTVLSSGASAQQVQNALNTVLAANGGGTVSVTKASVPVIGSNLSESVFTIIFQGALAGVNVAQLVAIASGSATVNTSVVATGGAGTIVSNGAALDIDPVGNPVNSQTSITINGESLHLNGTGVGNTGALNNISGNNTWTGAPVTLDTSSYVGAVGNTSLTVSGGVNGAASSELDKVGTGTLFFPTANNYQGTTVIQAGILNIAAGTTAGPNGPISALGAGISNDVQTITLSGATTGSFQVTFKSGTTPARQVQFTTPATLQADLQALGSIGPNNVTVTGPASGAGTYTVTFTGALAGQDEPQMTGTATNGTQIAIATTQHGGLGDTKVLSGGTLQVQGNITVSSEKLTITGNGQGGIGALDSASGTNTWDNPITMAGSSAIGSETGSTLIIDKAISESSSPSSLTKVGPGILEFTGGTGTDNTYTGPTTVNDGTLQLGKTGGAIAVPTNLTVGDGVADDTVADIDTVQLLASNQINPAATVTVLSDGLYDVNGQTQTDASLTINDGTATADQAGTHAGGVLTVGALAMTGGTLGTGSATEKVVLTGTSNTAKSDALGSPAVVNGSGTLSVTNATPILTVNHGAGPIDLSVQTTITAAGLTKNGSGRMQLTVDNTGTLTGPLTVTAGDVQVDGKVGEVDLNGGTASVSGIGNVANIDNGSAGTAPVGTIYPGDNGSANPVGTLTSTPPAGTAEVWGSGTTFAVDLVDASKAPGVGNDLLVVQGAGNTNGVSLNLGNGVATLTGTVGPNIHISDSFTIIQTTGGGLITGTFAAPQSPGIVFIGGEKFTVTYNPTSVVLNRVVNSATVTVASSASPAVYGQDFVFTATVHPEPGAGIPVGDNVQFTLLDSMSNVVAQTTSTVDANGHATFDPIQFTGQPLPIGTYNLNVVFNPNGSDSSYNTSSTSLNPPQQVVAANTTTKVTFSPSSPNPVYGQPVTFTATVAPVAPGAGTPTGTVTFFIDGGTAMGGSQETVTLTAGEGGVVTITVPDNTITNALAVGQHSVTASYTPDTNNYNASNSNANPVTVTVQKDTPTVNLSANPPSPGVVGQPVTFTAVVTTNAPGTAAPTGTVTFKDGNTTLTTVNLQLMGGQYQASYTTSSLALGNHTINAVYNGNTQVNTGTASLPYTINPVGTNLGLTAAPNPAVVGQQVSFTATVSDVAPGTGTPVGSVTFKDGNTTLGTVPLNNSNQAIFNTSGLAAGSHNITATYNPSSPNFGTSSNSLTEVVNFASATTLNSSPNPSSFGQNVTFTITVQPGAGQTGAGRPTGTVTLTDTTTSTTLTTINLPAGSGNVVTVTYQTSTLAVGTHAVVAMYNPAAGSNFNASASTTDNQAVQSVSGMTLTSSQNPQGFGQPVTFSATVSATSPGAQTPTGTVTFTDTTTNATLGTGTLTMTGPTSAVATLTLSSLGVGPHHIVASYPGDGATAAATANLTETIQQAATTTALSSSVNPSVVGQAVTFTATVTPAGGGTPTGIVTFTDLSTSTTLGFVSLTGGMATLTTSGLARGTHNIQAFYNGSATFGSSPSNVVTQSVLIGDTTYVWSSLYASTPNQPVTFTALVVPNTNVGTPVGSIQFFNNGNPIGTVPLTNGAATLTTAGFAAGSYNITAQYSGDANYGASTGAFNQSVIASLFGTAAFVNGNPGADSAHSPFNVNVYALDTNAGIDGNYTEAATLRIVGGPAGGTFSGGATSVAGKFAGGVLSFSNLLVSTPGTYTLEADSGTLTTQMTIQVLNSTTTYVWSSLYASTPNQPVTFTALVVPNTNVGTPTGSIQFFNNGVSMGTVPLTNGAATLSTAGFAAGSYNITAQYSGDASYSASTGAFKQSVISFMYGFAAFANGSAGSDPTHSPFNVTTYALDTNGVIDGNYTEAATVRIVNGPAGGTFSGGATSVAGTFSGGVLSINNLTVTTRGTYTLEVDSGTLATQMTIAVLFGTTTSVTSSLNASTPNQSVTFTAIVLGTGAGTPPGGTVQFLDNGTPLGTVPLGTNGQAMLTTTALGAGSHTITAQYSGDVNYSISSGSMTESVVSFLYGVTSFPSGSPGQDPAHSPFNVTAYALDTNGNIDGLYNESAVLKIISGPSGGTFANGLMTVNGTFQGGIVSFNSLFVTKPGDYVFEVDSGTLATQEGASFTIHIPGRLT